MEFFVGDPHINHKMMIVHCNRPFRNITEHDEKFMENWNSVVGQKDHVYVLGDFIWKDKKYAVNYINHLKGKIFFLKGNHDRAMKGEVLKKVICLPQYHELTIQDPKAPGKKQLLVLCHYPIESWNRKRFGTIHLHGHSHGKLKHIIPNRVDVGVDCWNYFPVSYEQIKMHIKRQAETQNNVDCLS